MAPPAVVIAIDTNLLIYAHRTAVAEHRRARRAVEAASGDPAGGGIRLPGLGEFGGIVTHPAASGRPPSAAEAAGFLRALVAQGGMQVWGPGPGFPDRLLQLATDLDASGVRIFDLQIALIAFESGATELWTHDRSFLRISGLRVSDPLV